MTSSNAETSLSNQASSGQYAQGSTRFASDFAKRTSIDYLNYDYRPTFVLDLKAYTAGDDETSQLAFCNGALLSSSGLYGIVERSFSGRQFPKRYDDERAFASWTISQYTSTNLKKSKVFFDTLWTVTPTPDAFAIVSGVELSQSDFSSFNSADDTERSSQHDDIAMLDISSRNSISSMDTDSRNSRGSKRSRARLGETWPSIGLPVSAHIAFVRDFDWASTSLGAIDTWSPQLRQVVEMMLGNPDPTTVFWGSDLILIYNEPYIALAGNKHPAMMGGSARVYWKEVWDQYDPLFDKMRSDGKAFKQENAQLITNRKGFMEEGFYNIVVMPILGEDGTVVGFYEPVSEVTKQTLSERRMHTLLQISECTSGATSLKDLWRRLLGALSGHESDIYFAGLYSLQHDASPELSPQYHLEGSVGFGEDTNSFRKIITINGADQDGVIPALRSAHASRTPVLLRASDQTLTPSVLHRLKLAGIAEAPRAFVVYPLSCSVDDCIEAFMTIGISPKRELDDDYHLFVNLIARQVESTITFVKLFEKEKDRLKQQAVYESELKFKQFAETAQVGIFNFDPVGNIRFCNEAWLELTGHDRNDMSAMSWSQDVHPDNLAETKRYWDKIVNLEGGPQTFEVQYKKPWTMNRGGEIISLDRTWVVASAYAEVSEDGHLTGILGCITDISSWKWVDQLSSQRLSEALELKRQQENFLDITSHEMRNPLNAILHCANELVELLTECWTNIPTDDRAFVVTDCLDASRTIVYCGRHQKRIIDDVLTLSKLDSNLLSISPVATRAPDVVEEVLKVFDTELRASSIETKTELAESYEQSRIDTVLIDPHRVIQVLINLVANAIKFTKGESLRSLHIVVSAFSEEPISSDKGVRYVPSGRHREDPTQNAEWGDGDIIFLHFSVQDTGPGMTQQEAESLFNRFAQGSPRTHVQYGGSGLGLFISRELAELHGGRIGISSELGLGSTFDFYVKGRRSTTQTAPSPPTIETPTGRKLPPNRRLSDGRPPPMSHSSKSSPTVLQAPSFPPTIHVLVVEDNLINQKILAKLMRKQGYGVSIANHGEEALAIIMSSFWHIPTQSSSTKNPIKLDVVLADIEMPVMNGKEFVRTVREWQAHGRLTNDIPVIAVTGNARSEQMTQALTCGFDDVVAKPYQVQDLVRRIEKFTHKD